MRYYVSVDGQPFEVEITARAGLPEVRLMTPGDATGRVVDAELVTRGQIHSVRVGGALYELTLDRAAPEYDVTVNGRRGVARVESAKQRAMANMRGSGADANDGTLCSPMPGKVVKLLAKVGDEIEAGVPLAVVEAMKMENELLAPRTGVVREVRVAVGDAVEGGAPLLIIE